MTSINKVKFSGGTPVYADCAPTNLNPSLTEIQKVYREGKTRALILCHTYGVCCPDIQEISDWCKEKKIVLIEDICEAIGTRVGQTPEKLVGMFSDFGIDLISTVSFFIF